MYNPFQVLTDAFAGEYRVNFSLESPDGSITLRLYDANGMVAKRLISPKQRNDPWRLDNLIQSIRVGIDIDRGRADNATLLAMHAARVDQPTRAAPGQVCI